MGECKHRLRPGSGAMVGDKSVGSRLSSSSGDRTRTNAHQSPPLDSPARHAKVRSVPTSESARQAVWGAKISES